MPVHTLKPQLYILKKHPGNHLIIEIKLSPLSKSSKGNNFSVLSKTGVSCFVKGLFLRSNLNLLEFAVKISNSSKFIVQLHYNRWSDIADCLTFLKCFPFRLEIPICSAGLV